MEYSELLNKFEPIPLTDMKSVRLMDRTDTKYVFHIDKLAAILEKAKKDYLIFEMSGNLSRTYKTSYYDTEDFTMYYNHLRGKLNRHKIRERLYTDTNEKFIEIKFKNNKGDTKKIRIESNSSDNNEVPVVDFIDKNSPFQFKDLKWAVTNSFARITLVSKLMHERVTIDYKLQFENESKQITVPELVIIEQKKSRNNKNTKLSSILLEERIFPMGFSKYCMGLIFTNDKIKYNRFKRKLLYLNKRDIKRIETIES